jgi:hypothetical protein
MIRHTALSIELFRNKEGIKNTCFAIVGKQQYFFESKAVKRWPTILSMWFIDRYLWQWQSCHVNISTFPKLVLYAEHLDIVLLSAEYHENVIIRSPFKLERMMSYYSLRILACNNNSIKFLFTCRLDNTEANYKASTSREEKTHKQKTEAMQF